MPLNQYARMLSVFDAAEYIAEVSGEGGRITRPEAVDTVVRLPNRMTPPDPTACNEVTRAARRIRAENAEPGMEGWARFVLAGSYDDEPEHKALEQAIRFGMSLTAQQENDALAKDMTK